MARKTKDDYDGVIYEPSDYIEPRRAKRPSGQAPPRRSGTGARARKSASRSQFTIFYVLTLMAAVTLCIVIFLVVFNTASSRTPNATPPSTDVGGVSPIETEEPVVAIEETTMVLGFIQDIPSEGHQVRVLDIDSGVLSTLTADAKTVLTSRFGQTMLFSEFRVGDMVEATYVSRTNVLKAMSVSSDSWEYKQVKDLKVDVVNQTLTYGNDAYKFGKGFVVRYKDMPYRIEDISPMDVCTIRGYKDTIWALDVQRSHGTLVIIGKDEIIDGLVEIDTDVFTMLDSFETMDLVEGEHRLVIKGANVEPFVSLVMINPGEVSTVDLAEIQLKSGVLRLTVNESFYTLTVDGEIVSTSEPVVLPYGTHNLRVEKDEFEPWEGTVEVSTPTVDVDVNLQRIYHISRLIISTVPEGASIYVDGVYVGLSPANVPVDAGMHTFMASLEGYTTVSSSCNVVEREHRLTITMQPRNPDFP